MDREIGQLVAAAQARLAELSEIVTGARYGEPAEELARYGDIVDLLIIGPHKQRPIDRFWGGSTAQRVADDVHCPLVVLSRAVTP
jgi:nucleotide-binding universal stress UspA family protein